MPRASATLGFATTVTEPTSSPTRAWRKPFFVLAALTFAVAAAVSVRYVEQRFDDGDRRHAVEIVRGYHSAAGRSLREALMRRHPDARGTDVRWESETLSACFQYVRVRAFVTLAGGRTVVYAWDVDINTVSIHPGNANGMAVLRSL